MVRHILCALLIPLNISFARESPDGDLLKASEKGDTTALVQLLARGANIEEADQYGRTPLIIAVRRGHIPAVKLLLQRGSNTSAQTKSGMTALHLASAFGQTTIVRLLLEHGADINMTDNTGDTPLFYAVTSDSIECARLFLGAHADIDVRNTLGQTPLMRAAMNGKAGMVDFLLANGANVHAKDNSGNTALHNVRTPQITQSLTKAGAVDPKARPPQAEETMTYISPRKLFSIKHPGATNPFVRTFEVEEATESTQADFDMVAFVIRDFGEVFLASVRRIPQQVLTLMDKEEPHATLSNLAEKALYDWRENLEHEPLVVDNTYDETPLGPGLLRMYLAKKGSLLTRQQSNGNRIPFDTYIAVLVVRVQSRFVSAIAENDYRPLDKTALAENLRTFFSTIKLDP